MKNLDISNPQLAHPRSFVALSAVISMLSGLMGFVLVTGVMPKTPMEKNPIGIFCCLVMLVSAMSFFLPRLMSWDWRSEYFGVPLFHVSTISLLGIIPLLCLVFYSGMSGMLRSILFFLFAMIHFWWVRRFLLLYKRIFCDERLVSMLYCEMDGQVFYMQNVDKYLIEKIFKFRQFPADRYLVVWMIVSFSLLFCVDSVISLTGLPFIYSFLAMVSLPVSLAFIGLAARGWLIFYSYPRKIYRESGRRVYVDMMDFPVNFKRNMVEWKRSLKPSKVN